MSTLSATVATLCKQNSVYTYGEQVSARRKLLSTPRNHQGGKVFCTNCGSPNQTDRFCDQCGTELSASAAETGTTPPTEAQAPAAGAPSEAPNRVPSAKPTPATETTPGQKNLALVWGLAVFLGNLGVDRFYLGKITSGIFKLLTLGGFGVWTFVDVLLLAFNKTKDKKGVALHSDPSQRKLLAWLTLPMLFISFIVWISLYSSLSQ